MRRVKIVATIGPASHTPEVLDALVEGGLDVARLNASHGDHETLGLLLPVVRSAAERAGRHVAVMLDLSGPKVRVGEMLDGVVLTPGDSFDLVFEQCVGDSTRASVTHVGLAGDVTGGDVVLLSDGRIRLRVESVSPTAVTTRVETGGPLASRKGVNVPERTLSVEGITPTDLEDLAWGIEAGVDLVAQSFVRRAEDVARLRAAMGEHPVPIVAKIETHEALDSLEDIVAEADAVMVARGDLGVETSPEMVPVLQRRLVGLARDRGRPVIIATEMLESMVTAQRPTRAEASDVATAVFQRADAVMLSAETAIGAHPVEAVLTAARIAGVAEEAAGTDAGSPASDGSVTSAVSDAARELAEGLQLAAIVTATQGGATARAVARHRPATPIVAVTPHAVVARQLALTWGVEPLVVGLHGSMEETFAHAVEAVRRAGLACEGDLVALTAGLAVGVSGSTDTVQVRRA